MGKFYNNAIVVKSTCYWLATVSYYFYRYIFELILNTDHFTDHCQ